MAARALQRSFFRSRSPRVAFVLQLAPGKERERGGGRDGKHKGDSECNALPKREWDFSADETFSTAVRNY